MKTVIAKRDKSIFYFFLLCVLGTLLLNGHNLVRCLRSDLRWFGIFSIACLSIITFIALFGLIALPVAVLVKEDETLIVYQGLANKKKIAWSSILSAEVLVLQEKKESKNGDILLKIKTEKGEESISVYQVKDKKSVVENLNNLLKV
jgi:hypothetical protein